MTQIPNSAPGAKRLMQVLMGGAGLVLLGGGGVLVGLNSRLAGLQTQAQQKEHEVGSSEQITKRYQQTQATYDETQSRIKFLETSVSAKSYVPTLLSQLQALAAQTHLTVTAVRPAAPAPPPAPPVKKIDGDAPAAATDTKKQAPPPYDTLLVDVDVSGSYADTAAFLYGLTRFPKILSVAGAQMRPGSAAAGADPNAPPVIATSLKLVAFVFPDSGPASSASAVPAVTAVPVAAPVPAAQKVRGADAAPAAIGAISPAAGHVAAGAASASHTADLHTGQLSTL